MYRKADEGAYYVILRHQHEESANTSRKGPKEKPLSEKENGRRCSPRSKESEEVLVFCKLLKIHIVFN